MTPERWQQISRIFKSAISLDSEARAAYLKAQCSDDDSLRAQVEELLASHRRAGDEDFIGGLAAEAAAPLLIDDDAAGPTRPTLTKGQQFGSYVVLDSLGAGGMGEVYLARDTRLDRTVALKVLSSDISQDKRRMQRFRQEAKVASSLNQPNILTIFEFGEVDRLTFIATEFIDGETLRHHLHGKRLKLPEVLDISIQVLAALDAAHDARIVHRDIKPENVMIRRRDHVVKVLDFGLAKLTEKKVSQDEEESEAATEFKTAPGFIMGTLNYMSPEQAQAHAVDVRTDIWSTGVMIYEMVTGVIPFSGATTSHTIVQILEKDPVPLTKVVQAPAELERVVAKAMAKNPDERYQTAKDMLIDLRSLKKRLDIDAEIHRTSSPDTPAHEVDTDPGRRIVLLLALIAMAVVTASIFAFSVWRSRRSSPSSSVTTPVAPPVERTLTYWITVQKFKDGQKYQAPFTLAGEINFEPSYHIRVHIRSPEQGYLYIFNEGPPTAAATTEYVVVFPSTTANNNSSLISAGQEVQIPEKSWLEFDQQQGVEKLWLVFSKDTVAELESARQAASPQTKNLIADAGQNKVVGDFLAKNSIAKPESEKGPSLTTLKSPGNLLVYAIKLEHH
ncbi:MAG TPA: protein kinase [Pyrinomonadaceae bacterium]|nr:protein kinase [Pyrinomonadaceae bacterium]